MLCVHDVRRDRDKNLLWRSESKTFLSNTFPLPWCKGFTEGCLEQGSLWMLEQFHNFNGRVCDCYGSCYFGALGTSFSSFFLVLKWSSQKYHPVDQSFGYSDPFHHDHKDGDFDTSCLWICWCILLMILTRMVSFSVSTIFAVELCESSPLYIWIFTAWWMMEQIFAMSQLRRFLFS